MHICNGKSSSFLSRIAYFTSIALLIAILHHDVVSAVPLDSRDDTIEPDDPSSNLDNNASDSGSPFSPTTDGYPSLDECRKACRVASDVSVFYSKVGEHTDKPQKFADSINGKLVREAYPSGFTDKNDQYTGYTKFA